MDNDRLFLTPAMNNAGPTALVDLRRINAQLKSNQVERERENAENKAGLVGNPLWHLQRRCRAPAAITITIIYIHTMPRENKMYGLQT